MACDVCRALRLWERKRERERERKEPQESEYPLRSFVFVILCRNCRWTVTSTCTRVLKRYQFSYQRSKTPRGYKGYVRWGRVRFSLARLFHSFSFFFFFFFFSRRQIMASPRRGEIPESSVGHPMPFSLSIAGPRIHVGRPVPGKGSRDIFPCVSFSLYLTLPEVF